MAKVAEDAPDAGHTMVSLGATVSTYVGNVSER